MEGRFMTRIERHHMVISDLSETNTEPQLANAEEIKIGKVVVSKGKARLFKEGNPLVYGGAIQSVRGNPDPGDLVVVTDVHDNAFAWGVFNPFSMYRVRILARKTDDKTGMPSVDLKGLLKKRIKTAKDLRQALNLPSELNTAYRLINGEGDHLSGLVVDVYGKLLVVSASALWVQRWKKEITEALKDTFDSDYELVWRESESRLKQDGWQEEIIDLTEEQKSSEDRKLIVMDQGVKYQIRPEIGQKTGFYCDQRENRALVRELSEDRDVLDMFCYTGGFSLNAALGNAKSVKGVDSSALAVETATNNANLNGLADKVDFVKADAYQFLKEVAEAGTMYDLIILDPPKLAPNRKSLPRAINKYKKLNAAALRCLRPGGLLFTFTCSSAMAQSGNFVSMVQDAASLTGSSIRLLKKVGTAPDHAISPLYPEGEYLFGALFYHSV